MPVVINNFAGKYLKIDCYISYAIGVNYRKVNQIVGIPTTAGKLASLISEMQKIKKSRHYEILTLKITLKISE